MSACAHAGTGLFNDAQNDPAQNVMGDYTPPPMFGDQLEKKKPALPDYSDNKALGKNTVVIDTAPLLNKQQADHLKAAKKMRAIRDYPLPRKRPETFHASRDFINKIRAQNNLAPLKAPKAEPVRPRVGRSIIDDDGHYNLKNLNAEDILKEIE